MKRLVLAVAIAVVAALAVSIAALGSPQIQRAATVNVRLKEFKVLPTPKSVRAGRVTFVARNVGKIEHELVVIRTNRKPGSLPVSGGKASERGSVGEVADLAPGETGRVTLRLRPGKYVLICNVRGHYQAGQYVGFVVR